MLVLIGGLLALPGIWLVVLGGSWYYLLAGLGFVLTGVLLIRYGPIALWAYALLLAGTLAWALASSCISQQKARSLSVPPTGRKAPWSRGA